MEAELHVGRGVKASNRLRSALLNVISRPAIRAGKRRVREGLRRLTRARHEIDVFLQLDDPYSYLLAHYLPALQAHYDVDIRLHLTESIGGEFQPAADMQPEYAVLDCERVARELGIPFLDKGCSPPAEHRVALMDAIAASVGSDDFAAQFRDALTAYWRGDSSAVARRVLAPSGAAARLVQESQKRQRQLGHYASAMTYYGGEWYWGVDRLSYLLERLQDLGAARDGETGPQLASIRQSMRIDLPVRQPAAAKDLPPLEMFYSIRSPYSYLALQRTVSVADAFGVKLQLRPVLPMLMRGMSVPRLKLLYIAADTLREAQLNGVRFGNFADPLGLGVERGMAVFEYARTQNRGAEFLQHLGAAIWADGIDITSEKGMRKVTAKSGLFWPEAQAAMYSDDWRVRADNNLEALLSAGCWGVPTLRLDDYVVWGQDRLWLMARHLEDLCESDDGIIV